MSKNCIISLIIGCFVYSLLSCSESYPYCEDEYDKTWISVYPSSITIDKDELAGSFSVSSNRKWTVYSEPYWLYLSTYSGNGNKSIDFTVSENTGYSNRSGNILIRTEDGAIKEQSIYITQAPTTPFSVTMNTTSYGSSSDWQTMSITAASSKSWTISKTHSWVHLGSSSSTLSSYSGTGSGNVKIYVDENTSSYSRNSTLTVKCGTDSKVITITQEAPTPFEVTMNTTNYKADGDWWTMSISAASSKSWTISKSHSWVHFGSSSNSSYTYYGTGSENVRIYVDANTSSYSRSSTLTVKCGTNTKEITITQEASTSFDVTMSTTNYKADGDWWYMSITAASSQSWNISKTHSWVHLGSSSSTSYTYYGTGNESVKIYVDANTSSYSRSSTLTVKCGTNTKEITITQEASNTTSSLEISISNTYFYGNKNDSETLTITTSSSQYWTVSADAYWVSFSKTSGYGSSTVTVYTTANPYSYERYATITVKAGTISKTKDIRQGSK